MLITLIVTDIRYGVGIRRGSVIGNFPLQENSTISHMTFADDLVLFAKDDVLMQVDHVLFRLTQCGLNINKSKCANLNIIINPKKKQWICNPYSFISIDNSTIKALNIE